MKQTFHYLSMANHSMIQKKLMERIKNSGLTLGQPKVLDYLGENDGANQKEIAAACHIEPGSLTSILNRMEEKEMIERRILNGNRRTFHVFLTAYGKELQKKVDTAFQEIEKEALEGINEQEYTAFMNTFQKMYQNLTDVEKGKKEVGNE